MVFDHALEAQRQEISEHHLYLAFAKRARGRNKEILMQIAADELRHYEFWKKITKRDVKPDTRFVWWYKLLAATLGLRFTLKLREMHEQGAQEHYKTFHHVKGINALIKDEARHETALIEMLKDERLEYAGAIVLGLNDGLVELTGVLAGLTFALSDNKLIAVAGLVTGIAAALSMAASGYFSSREEGRDPVRSALYTGIAYLVVVFILVLPYLLLSDAHLALPFTLLAATLLIAGYSYYIAVAKSQSFWRRFLEMVIVSMGVAAISFGVGMLLRTVFGIEA